MPGADGVDAAAAGGTGPAARPTRPPSTTASEGYGLWLDPAVADNPVYSEHWAGHRAVTVTFDAEAITIRRAGAGQAESDRDADRDADD